MLYESLESFLWNLLPLTLATRSLPKPKRHSETSKRQRASTKPLDSNARWVVQPCESYHWLRKVLEFRTVGAGAPSEPQAAQQSTKPAANHGS